MNSNLLFENRRSGQELLMSITKNLYTALKIPKALDIHDKRLAGFEAERCGLVTLNTGQGYPRFKAKRLINFKPWGLENLLATPPRFHLYFNI